MDPTTLVAIAVATVVSLLGSLIVTVAGWMEARRGERHAVERAMLAERTERRAVAKADIRVARMRSAILTLRAATEEIAADPSARHIAGWGTLRRAFRAVDDTIMELDDDTAETVNPARM